MMLPRIRKVQWLSSLVLLLNMVLVAAPSQSRMASAATPPLITAVSDGTARTTADQPGVATATPAPETVAPSSLSLAPIFMQNVGQWHPDVAFRSSAAGAQVFVTHAGELVYGLATRPAPAPTEGAGDPRRAAVERRATTSGWSLVETFVNGRPTPVGASSRPTQATWMAGDTAYQAKQFEQVRLGEVWPGIAVALHQRGDAQEKVFTVASGADATQIQVAVRGADRLAVDESGQLVLDTGQGPVTFSAPLAYQHTATGQVSVAVAYAVTGNQYSFTLGAYDRAVPLIIDPVINATFAGGGNEDQFFDTLIVPGGSLYAVGTTRSADYPGTNGGAQAALAMDSDGVIARYSPDLSRLEHATYLGGDGTDVLYSIDALFDASAHATSIVVAGETTSTDFPGTAGSADPTYNGNGDAIVALLDLSLATVTRATYFGGANTDYATDVAMSAASEVVIAGTTESAGLFDADSLNPTYQGGTDGFLAVFDRTLGRRQSGMYAGGREDDAISSIQMLPSGLPSGIYVTGYSNSPEFMTPTGVPAFNIRPQVYGSLGGDDVVSFRITDLRMSICCSIKVTHGAKLGGPGDDRAYTLTTLKVFTAGDAFTYAFIGGETNSVGLGSAGALEATYGGGSSDGFVVPIHLALSNVASIRWFSYIGGSGADIVWTINPDTVAYSYFFTIGGQTTSHDLPTTEHSFQQTHGGGIDGFLQRATLDILNQHSQSLRTTYLGGTEDDIVYATNPVAQAPYVHNDGVFIAGQTGSGNFPGTDAGAQPRRGGGIDGFVARLTRDLGTGGSIPVTTELALILDSSGSILDQDWSLQLDAYKAFFSQPTFYRDYVAPFGAGRIAVAAYNFSSVVRRDIDWTLIDSQATAEAFAAQFTPANVPKMGMDTALGSVLDQAGLDLFGNIYDGFTEIDLASDGVYNLGFSIDDATGLNEDRGVEVMNALAIGNCECGVLYSLLFGTNMDGSPPFLVSAREITNFAAALNEKLTREVSPGPLGVLGGQVWDDTDHDGVRDSGEPALGNVLVRLNNSGGATLATRVSAPNGTYSFAGLAAGTYALVFEPLPRYRFSPQHVGGDRKRDSDADATGRIDSLSFIAGQIDFTLDAGLYRDDTTAVDVLFLTATRPDGEGGPVVVRWATDSESDIVGFHLWRSTTTRRDEAVRVTNERIAARGTADTGAAYTWIDPTARPTTAYTYWLEYADATEKTHDYGPARTAVRVLLWVPQVRR